MRAVCNECGQLADVSDGKIAHHVRTMDLRICEGVGKSVKKPPAKKAPAKKTPAKKASAAKKK